MTQIVEWHLATQEERAALVRHYLVEQGYSYSQLAKFLGVTRNVIAGICNRNGIKIGTQRNVAIVPVLWAKDRPPRVMSNVVPFPSRPSDREEAGDTMAKLKGQVKAKRKISAQSMVIAIMAGRKEPPPDYAPPKVDRSAAWLPLPESQPVSVVDANARHCRWPISEDNHTWCGGHVKEGSVYCTGHHAIAYRPTPPINFDKRRRNGSAA
jgi:hypothetical protein